MGETGPVAPFTVVEVGNDVLLCTNRDGKQILVAKAWPFRKSEYHEEEFDGTTYESTDVDERTATAGGLTATEAVDLPYVVGEKVLAAKMLNLVRVEVEEGELTDIAAGDWRVDWEDMNAAGRGWPRTFGRPQRAQLVSEGDDSVVVNLYLADGSLDDEGTTVAKPLGMRKVDYNGATYDGATYTYVSASSRTADGATQDIIPSYRVGEDLYVQRPVGGTGLTDVEWQDMNNGQRWWLESP